MGFLTSVMSPKAVRESEFHGEAAWLADVGGPFGAQTSAGELVSPERAVTVSAVFACARNLAEDVAKLPLKAYRRLDGGGKKPAADDPRHASPDGRMVNLYDLVHRRPNSEMGGMKFRSLLGWWALIYGNGYAEVVRNSGFPVELTPIHPHRVTPKRDDGGRLYYKVRNGAGEPDRNIAAADMFHLAGISDDGLMGLVIPMIGKDSIGVYLAAEKFAGTYFGAGATLKGVVTFDGDFKTQEARKEYIASFNSAYNNNRWVLADQGAKVQPIGGDPEKSQLVDVLKFRIEDIARLWRIPPVMIGANTNTPYTNIEPLNQQYYLNGMMPWCIRFEEESYLKLVPSTDPDLFVEHVVEALMWADAKTRAEVMNLGIRGGWRNPNEARDIHNLNPIPGGGQFRVEQNLALLDENGVPIQVNQPAPPPPGNAPPDDDDQPEGKKPDPNAIKLAMMPSLVSVAERLIARESKALTGKKSVTASWLDDFYKGQHAAVVSEVSPLIETMARLSGTDAAGVAERFADQHVGESRRRIAASEDPGVWHVDRPAWIARYLTDEVCNG